MTLAFAIEGSGIEIGGSTRGGQWPSLHLLADGIDADDGVLPAIGDPGRAIGTDDHAMRR